MENYWILKKSINEIITHITTYTIPLNILCVLPEEENEIIKKKYKKLSLKIHPDRCNHPCATDAIAFLSKAMKSLENEDERKKYTQIINQARSDLVRELNMKGQLHEFTSTSPQYHQMLIDRSELILKQMNERIEKAEKIRQANIQREKEEIKLQEEREKKKKDEEEQWEKMRHQRVNNWKSFMKKQKLQKIESDEIEIDDNNSDKRNEKNEKRKPIKPPKATLFN